MDKSHNTIFAFECNAVKMQEKHRSINMEIILHLFAIQYLNADHLIRSPIYMQIITVKKIIDLQKSWKSVGIYADDQ